MKENIVACALAFTMALVVTAEDYSNYVQLNGVDADNDLSWNKAGKWSDGKAPSSTKNYYVPVGSLLWQSSGSSTSDADRTWLGGRLVIGGTFHTTVNNGPAYGPLVHDLVLLGGSECRVGCFAFLAKVNNVEGTVTVLGTADNPATISHHHANSSNGTRSYLLQAQFSGTAESVLVLTRPYVNYNGDNMDYGWSCELPPTAFATYPGTVIMRGGNFKAKPGTNTDSYNMPQATLRVEDRANCHFYRNAGYTASAAQIGTLDSIGGKLYFNCCTSGGLLSVNPVVNISERLNFDADTVITIPTNATPFLVGVSPGNPYGITHKIAHLDAPAAETLGDLSAVRVDVADNARLGYPVKLHAMSNGDGTKDVYLGTPDLVIMTNQNSSSSSSTAVAFASDSGWMWTSQEVPATDTSATLLAKSALTLNSNVSYPNATLSESSVIWSVGGTSYRFKTINLCGSSGMRSWGTKDQTRRYSADNLNVLAPSSTIDVSGSVAITIDADICGEGNLEIGNYDNGYGSVYLTHANTNFHGRLTIRQSQGSATALTAYKFTTELSHPCNWGGEYSDADTAYKAITLKDFPHVRVPYNVSFESSSRGILVQSGARFYVYEGKTLKLGNQVTYAGILEKNGLGTLELAGTARFRDGLDSTAPIAGTNALRIVAGALKISSKTAADGLAISFNEGTKLIIPADTEAGYFNTKWPEPLSIETADGKLPIEIIPDGIADGVNVTVPVCTFSTAAAENIHTSSFSVTMNKPNMRLKSFTKQPNGDDTVSYVAVFGPVGYRVIMR